MFLKISNFVFCPLKSALEDPKKLKNSKKRQAEEASVITLPPNLRPPSYSPPPSYKSDDNSNEESTEVEDVSQVMFFSFCLMYYVYKFVSNLHCSLKSNDRYESDVGITREGDNNPFIAQTGEDSTKYKVSINR